MPKSSLVVPRKVMKNGKEQWRVTTPRDLRGEGKPRRRFFSTQELAKQYAEELMSDRGTLAGYFRRLDEKGQGIVASLLARVNFDAAELLRLVDLGLKHSVTHSSVSVPSAVTEFIESKRRQGVGDHVDNYETDLQKQFAVRFPGPVAELRSPAIDDWLSEFEHPRTRNNKRGTVLTFLRWLQAREYVPQSIQWKLTRAIEPATDVAILTPEKMLDLLNAARKPRRRRTDFKDEQLIPFLSIAAFAGLRVREVSALDWSDVHLDRDIIHVQRSRTKRTRNTQSRMVPIQPNLKAWLLAYAEKKGPVCPRPKMSPVLTRLVNGIGMEWEQNALRHSYTSYRVAVTQNEAQVATEIGDLVTTMRKHYKMAVDPKVGAEWFAIAP